MFGLMYGLYVRATARPEYYVCVLGPAAAGKTTLVERVRTAYTAHEMLPPQKIYPTVGLNIGRIDVGGAEFSLWDLGGKRDMRSIWAQYVTSAHALLFVVDAADVEESERALDRLLHEFREYLMRMPVALVVNKNDALTPAQLERARAVFAPARFTREGFNVSPIFLTSALVSADGVRPMIDWVTSQVRAGDK